MTLFGVDHPTEAAEQYTWMGAGIAAATASLIRENNMTDEAILDATDDAIDEVLREFKGFVRPFLKKQIIAFRLARRDAADGCGAAGAGAGAGDGFYQYHDD